MAVDVTLRSGRADDLGFLRDLHRAAMRPHVEATWGPWDEEQQRELFLKSTDPLVHQIVEQDDAPVGCLWVRPHPGELELVRIYLMPAVQGRGLGTELVRGLCARATAEGLSVRLRVLRSNPAQRLYARLGFVVEEESDERLWMRWNAGD